MEYLLWFFSLNLQYQALTFASWVNVQFLTSYPLFRLLQASKTRNNLSCRFQTINISNPSTLPTLHDNLDHICTTWPLVERLKNFMPTCYHAIQEKTYRRRMWISETETSLKWFLHIIRIVSRLRIRIKRRRASNMEQQCSLIQKQPAYIINIGGSAWIIEAVALCKMQRFQNLLGRWWRRNRKLTLIVRLSWPKRWPPRLSCSGFLYHWQAHNMFCWFNIVT